MAGEAGGAEGVLTRKHDWENTTKKASNRSWDKVRHCATLNFIFVDRKSPLILICVIFRAGLRRCKKQPSNILQGPEGIEGHARNHFPR